MERNPTRMCGLLVGLADVNVLGVELNVPVRVHVETVGERPGCGECGANNHDRHTLTGIAAEIAHLRTGLEAIADRVRNQEERLRQLEHRQPRRKAN